MGEAKQRGTLEERIAAAVAKREAAEKREAEWNAKQAERRRIRLEEQAEINAAKTREVRKPVRNNRLLYAAAVGLAASSMIGMK